jgi:hypothetical protein
MVNNFKFEIIHDQSNQNIFCVLKLNRKDLIEYLIKNYKPLPVYNLSELYELRQYLP